MEPGRLTSKTLNLFASYEFLDNGWGIVEKAMVNLSAQLLFLGRR